MPQEKKESAIASFLEDLTHLQIDTVIKSGMTGVEPPDKVEELLYSLHCKYDNKLKSIISELNDDIQEYNEDHQKDRPFYEVKSSEIKSFKELADELVAMQTFMDENSFYMNEKTYIIFQRMLSFCLFLKSRSQEYKIKGRPNDNIFSIEIEKHNSIELELVTLKDLAKFKRFHDLGTEKVVMQTRIGIDGDIVSRISDSFANNPNQLIVSIHDKHTELSLKYWNKLVDMAVKVIGSIFTKGSNWFSNIKTQ